MTTNHWILFLQGIAFGLMLSLAVYIVISNKEKSEGEKALDELLDEEKHIL